jgi:alkanesulfonate monooxygenase SsuD/methylene tetrahydromethanopterin reductase-like flavin-dependent oxidoreductase (luciferase family)
MEFGFYLPCYWRDASYPIDRMYSDMVEQACLAEQLGFRTVWIPEHHFINLLVHPNPLLTGVRVAAATRTIRIGTSVLVLPFFDMRRLAGEVAQADNLMDGRLELGVGRGAFKYEFDRYGVKVEDSRDIFDESLALLERLLGESNVSSDTDAYRFPPLTITPRPLQQPLPPVWIAAVTPDAIYHTARRGYHVMTTPLRSSFDDAKRQAESYHRGRSESANPASAQRLGMLRMAYVARDRADIQEKLEFAAQNDRCHHNVRTTDGAVSQGMIQGTETGRSLSEIEDALIIGSADQCLEKVAAYAQLGIDEFIVNMGFGASHADVMCSLETFADKVMPHFTAAGEREHAKSL